MSNDKIKVHLLEVRAQIISEYAERMVNLKKLARSCGVELETPAAPAPNLGNSLQPPLIPTLKPPIFPIAKNPLSHDLARSSSGQLRPPEPLSLSEAIRKVLRTSEQKMSIPEIIDELGSYIDTDGFNYKGPFRNVVSASLSNLKKQGDVKHFKDEAMYMDRKCYEEKYKALPDINSDGVIIEEDNDEEEENLFSDDP